MVNPQFQLFRKQITHPFKFKMFMLANLPSAWFAGIKIVSLTEHEAIISVRQKWFNKNPFRSIYFAVLSIAAEVSTGILCMGNIYKRKPSVSMLMVKMESIFHKKATGKISFICSDGAAVYKTVEEAIASGQAKTITCYSCGKNDKNETVADFYFTWSFKAR